MVFTLLNQLLKYQYTVLLVDYSYNVINKSIQTQTILSFMDAI